MGDKTKIEWCDYTYNPWRGCSEVSPGCANCYAREMARRNPSVLGEWGDDGQRVEASQRYRLEPINWDRAARDAGERRRVFCGSMMDFFEDRIDLKPIRERVMSMINLCRYLDWLLLTKRPENISRLWREAVGNGQPRLGSPHIWLGTTVEDQKRAETRIPELLRVDAHTRFLSCEPLLEEVRLEPWLQDFGIHWVIVGGESKQGGRCRPCEIEWVESIVEQCRRYNAPVFVKQLGSMPLADRQQLRLINRKGGDMNEWPDHLRLRQFPDRR